MPESVPTPARQVRPSRERRTTSSVPPRARARCPGPRVRRCSGFRASPAELQNLSYDWGAVRRTADSSPLGDVSTGNNAAGCRVHSGSFTTAAGRTGALMVNDTGPNNSTAGLIGLLQSGRGHNAHSLAVECGVSRRTIFRDLDIMRAGRRAHAFRGCRAALSHPRHELSAADELHSRRGPVAVGAVLPSWRPARAFHFMHRPIGGSEAGVCSAGTVTRIST